MIPLLSSSLTSRGDPRSASGATMRWSMMCSCTWSRAPGTRSIRRPGTGRHIISSTAVAVVRQ